MCPLNSNGAKKHFLLPQDNIVETIHLSTLQHTHGCTDGDEYICYLQSVDADHEHYKCICQKQGMMLTLCAAHNAEPYAFPNISFSSVLQGLRDTPYDLGQADS